MIGGEWKKTQEAKKQEGRRIKKGWKKERERMN
jgi:hypothetical protein